MRRLPLALLLSCALAMPSLAKPPPPKKPAAAKPSKPDPKNPKSDDPLEQRLLDGELFTKGFYRADHKGFANADLNKLLVKYAGLNNVDIAATHGSSGSTHAKGGDLDQGVAAGVPQWLSVFQKATAGSTRWTLREAVQSKLMGAYYYRYFRGIYARHNASSDEKWAMPVSVEYFLQHLGKSLSQKQQKSLNGNGMADWETIGGGGPNYCAAASGQAMKHGFANYGLKMGPIGYAKEHGFKMLKATYPKSGKTFGLRPGDVCSIRSKTGPDTGHVITVVYNFDVDDQWGKGTMWVASGNAMLGSISVDFLSVGEATSTSIGTTPINKGKKIGRPDEGKIMLLTCTSDSDVHFAHWKGEDLGKFKVTKAGEARPAPDFPSTQSEKPKS